MLKRKFSFLFALALLFGSLQTVQAVGICYACGSLCWSSRDGPAGPGAYCTTTSGKYPSELQSGCQITGTSTGGLNGACTVVTVGRGGGGGGGDVTIGDTNVNVEMNWDQLEQILQSVFSSTEVKIEDLEGQVGQAVLDALNQV